MSGAGTKAVGHPLARIDGRLKVTGAARYAAEFDAPSQLYAVMVTSTMANGRIEAIDADAVQAMPGVRAVLSHRNAQRLPYREQRAGIDPASGERLRVLQDDIVRFFGQPVALVIAETLEQAEHAAQRVRVRYRRDGAPLVRMDDDRAEPIVPAAASPRSPADSARGDADAALRAAAVSVDQVYDMARESHSPMEPHATVASWQGDRLTLWSKSQFVVNEAAQIAAVFGVPRGNVEVICPFVGGAFGSALRTWPHVALCALAARQIGQPVKLVLTRRQMFTLTGHRPQTRQRLALGADRDGRLRAVIHEAQGETSRYEQFIEALTAVTPYMYSCENVRTRYRLVPVDSSTPTYMRGPGEADGIFALETALDELAVALKMDPVELRLKNEPEIDEGRKVPFSSRFLRECYASAGERFGWARRTPEPGSMRDGRLRVGWGMATATYPVLRSPASARVRLLRDGRAEVEAAASDMGPGTYTSMTQVAADALGLPVERVTFRLGHSVFPPAPPHGGSQTMAAVGSAVREAGLAARAKAIALAIAQPDSPLSGAAAETVTVVGGRLQLADGRTGPTYADLSRLQGTPIEAEVSSAPGEERQRYSMHAFGAVFAEVKVDPDLGQVQVSRVVGAYDAGRIINPKLATSQCIGGIVGGIGMALLEQTVVDPRDGRVVNASMADYLVPVNLDIGSLDVMFVDRPDPHTNALGVKGLGEIALIGVAPAIGNAIYHATGKRLRSLPIHLEQLLET